MFGGGFGGSASYNEETDPAIIINGGVLNLDSSSDSIDSNGSLFINGGEIYVNGPNSNIEIAIDFDNGLAEIDGGTLIAVGGSSNMMSNFSTTSEQVSFTYFFSSQQSAGATLEIKDASGNVVVSIEPTKGYSSVMVSHEDLKQGETYTITNGTVTETITLSETSTVTSNSSSQSSMGGRGNR